MTPLRLLLIEDREDDAALVVRELSLAGYDVMSARVDTPDALRAALTRQPWDVAIAEDTMPRFRGTAALSLLRTYDAEVPLHLPVWHDWREGRRRGTQNRRE